MYGAAPRPGRRYETALTLYAMQAASTLRGVACGVRTRVSSCVGTPLRQARAQVVAPGQPTGVRGQVLPVVSVRLVCTGALGNVRACAASVAQARAGAGCATDHGAATAARAARWMRARAARHTRPSGVHSTLGVGRRAGGGSGGACDFSVRMFVSVQDAVARPSQCGHQQRHMGSSASAGSGAGSVPPSGASAGSGVAGAGSPSWPTRPADDDMRAYYSTADDTDADDASAWIDASPKTQFRLSNRFVERYV